MIKQIFAIIGLSLSFILLQQWVYASPQSVEVRLDPSQIQIGAAYNGTTVSITGNIPMDTDAVIRIMGHMQDIRYKKKGKALGLLWMNLGTVEFHQVPGVFLLYTAKASKTPGKGVGLGLDKVRQQAKIDADPAEQETLFDEFIKLKQHAGLYDIHEDAIHYTESVQDRKSFSCTVFLPANLPQGTYNLEVFAVKDNTVMGHADTALNVQETGVPAMISSLAFQHGAIYGIISVVVAILAGLLTGVLFKGGKGAH